MAAETKTVRSRRTRTALIGAVRERLRVTGNFTAAEIADDVGCTQGTFWAHFENKDDAITAAFQEALDEMIPLVERIFGGGPGGLITSSEADRLGWAVGAVDEIIAYFAKHELLYRLALSRLPEHRPLRHAFRATESRSIGIVSAAVPGASAADHGAAIICLCQGMINTILLHSKPGDPKRRFMSVALASLTLARP